MDTNTFGRMPDGRIPLFLSVRNGHKKIIKFLGSNMKKEQMLEDLFQENWKKQKHDLV